MTTSTTELPDDDLPEATAPADTPAEPAAVEVPAPAVAAPPPIPPTDNRRRLLRDLLSIPERDRTDAQWDEIIELEIQLAPGNRLSAAEQQYQPRQHGKPSAGGNPGGGQQKKHRPRPGGGGGGGGGGNNRRPRGNKPGGGQAAG